jgi:glycosyltransferase involved in cell wall biosynthesis
MKLSVVMAVYNGERTLAATVDSILAQTLSDFEFVIVDDGSSDRTPDILAAYALRDSRIRVITQANAGLTAALIVGCAAAKGDYIARQDCGDLSLRERFEKQMALASAGHVLVSCATQFVGPEGEPLYVARGDGERVRDSLLHAQVDTITGLSGHGSALFRRDSYLNAGGYRREFRLAQDIDLWIRLAALGTIAFSKEILYEVTWEPGGLSGRGPEIQIAAAKLSIELRDAPPERHPELLARVQELTHRPRQPKRGSTAPTWYFIASCLLAAGDPRWRKYARRAVRENPFHLRSWIKLLTHR